MIAPPSALVATELPALPSLRLRVTLIAFGLSGWLLLAGAWVSAWRAGLPDRWVLFQIAPLLAIGACVVWALIWVAWNRRYTRGDEQRARPVDEPVNLDLDRLGRPLIVEAGCLGAAQLEIVLDGESKVVRRRVARG